MKKITFLFGAGAEGREQYDLPSGAIFNRDILVSENGKDLFEALNKNSYKKVVKARKSKNIYFNNYSSLYYLYQQNNDFRNLMSDKEKEICDNYLKYKEETNLDKNEYKSYKEEFQKLFKERIYDKIVKNSIDGDPLLKFFLENSLLIDNLDSSFSSLSCPASYKNEVWRVINCYCAAYASIYKAVYNSDYPKSRSEAIETINKPLVLDRNPKNTYYSAIKGVVESFKDIEFAFCTTNYTNIAENVIGQDQDFCYLHGRMDLFENLITKEVKTLDQFLPSDIVFPFLAIRSGIKPLINSRQIKEWNKFVTNLEDSDVLIIVGYGFNNDDEHITNIIRETIAKDSIKIYQTNYRESVSVTNSIPGIKGVISINCDYFEEKLYEICHELRGQ